MSSVKKKKKYPSQIPETPLIIAVLVNQIRERVGTVIYSGIFTIRMCRHGAGNIVSVRVCGFDRLTNHRC